MAFVTPTAESIISAGSGYPGQAVLDATDIACVVAAVEGTGVVSGCQVSCYASGSTFAISISAGTIMIAGISYTISAVTNFIPGGYASSSVDRRDIVSISSSGTPTITQGTPVVSGTSVPWSPSTGALPPVKGAIPAGNVLLGELYVQGGATFFTAANIVDKTFILPSQLVLSFNGRTGAVVPATGDYTAAQVGAVATGGAGGKMFVQTSGTITPGVSGTYGTAVNIVPDGSSVGIFPTYLYTSFGGTFASETVTIKVVVTYSDTTSATVNPSTPMTGTATGTNSPYGQVPMVGMMKDGVYITNIAVSATTTASSTAATAVVHVGGLTVL